MKVLQVRVFNSEFVNQRWLIETRCMHGMPVNKSAYEIIIDMECKQQFGYLHWGRPAYKQVSEI